jgi:hypothetical protein
MVRRHCRDILLKARQPGAFARLSNAMTLQSLKQANARGWLNERTAKWFGETSTIKADG